MNSLNISMTCIVTFTSILFCIYSKLQGLLKVLSLTYICFLITSLNLTGIPFYPVAFCEDEILNPQVENLVWLINLPIFDQKFENFLFIIVTLVLICSVFF